MELVKNKSIVPRLDITYFLNPDYIYVPAKKIYVKDHEYVYKNQIVADNNSSSISGHVLGIKKCNIMGKKQTTLVIQNDYREYFKETNKKEKITIPNMLKVLSNEKELLDKLKSSKTFNNIVVYESNISFDIINTSNEILELANYNYFINLYDQNKKLLQRLMLRDEVVSPNKTLKVTFSLTDSNVYSLTILSISKDNYPAYVATADENNMATLTCTKDYEKVDYLLNNNKVYAISLLYEVGVDDANFNTLYGTYQAMQVSYNSIEGVSSSIETINNVLSFRTIINLNTIGDEKINLKTFYPKDTDAKVMNFELTSMGYTCK